jgi:hypothetical protein
MDERDLTFDKPTHKDIVAVTDRSRHGEDLVTFLVRPPVTSNALSRYGLSKRRDWPFRGLKHNTVLADESESLA